VKTGTAILFNAEGTNPTESKLAEMGVPTDALSYFANILQEGGSIISVETDEVDFVREAFAGATQIAEGS
jgi:hypothetical protein